MKAEPSRLIPPKPTKNLKLLIMFKKVSHCEKVLSCEVRKRFMPSHFSDWRDTYCDGCKAVPNKETSVPPSLGIGTKNQNCLEKLKSAAYFRLIDCIFSGMTLAQQIATFTVLVSCSDELGVHSCALICLQRQVAKLASGLF